MFALVAFDELYLKVDDESVAFFRDLGSRAFSYETRDGRKTDDELLAHARIGPRRSGGGGRACWHGSAAAQRAKAEKARKSSKAVHRVEGPKGTPKPLLSFLDRHRPHEEGRHMIAKADHVIPYPRRDASGPGIPDPTNAHGAPACRALLARACGSAALRVEPVRIVGAGASSLGASAGPRPRSDERTLTLRPRERSSPRPPRRRRTLRKLGARQGLGLATRPAGRSASRWQPGISSPGLTSVKDDPIAPRPVRPIRWT